MQEVDYLTCLNIPSTYEPSRIGLETQNQVKKWRCAQKHHRMRGIVSMTPTVLSSYTIRHDRNLKQKTWPLRSTCLSFSKLLDASCINHITTNLFLDASTAPKEWLPLPLLHNSCYLSSEEPPKACFFWNHRRSKYIQDQQIHAPKTTKCQKHVKTLSHNLQTWLLTIVSQIRSQKLWISTINLRSLKL